MNKTHELKTDPQVYDAVAFGGKSFELRLNDRNFKVGDTLLLRRTEYSGIEMNAGMPLEFSGKESVWEVTHILHGPIYGLNSGWVIMSIVPDTTPL